MVNHTAKTARSVRFLSSRRAILTAGAGTAALLLAPAAFAADAPAADAAAPSSSAVTEIVVTANKLNSSKVLEVPGAIQALSGAALQKAGAVGFLDIAKQIPGLAIQDLGPGDRKYIIR